MNLYGKLSKYFIENRKLSFLLLIGIILWGLLSFLIMPKQYNPDIVAPAFSIQVPFPGATVDEVYQVVTKPLENVLNEIPGIENIYSKSIHGGMALVIAEFYVGEDLEESMITLRQRISSRLDLAPLGVGEPYIASIDPEDLPIKTLCLYSDTVDPVTLRKKAFQLKEELKLVSGTSMIDVIGGKKREFQIILDPEKMKETKTSLDEMSRALNNTSLLRDFGLIKSTDEYYRIETQEQVVTTQDIENIIIISNVSQQLKIGDVATVVEGEKEVEHFVTFDNKKKFYENAVYIAISKKKGENIIQVSNRINELVESLAAKRDYLQDIQIDIVKDEGRVASEEIGGLMMNLIQAIGIVFIVLFAFLNPRAAVIVAFSIPITLLTVIAIGNLFGYTINRITLFALILSLGLLVDSATVVIENIVKNRKIHHNLSKPELISLSVSEVGVGLFLSTLTTVLAFIPMAFVTGMMGPYMGPLPFFVSTALIVALIFAYTLNPWLASLFCQAEGEVVEKEKKTGFSHSFQTFLFDRYTAILASLLENKGNRLFFLLICFVILFACFSLPLLQLLRFRMLPKADREQIYVYADLNRGSSIERSYQITNEMIALLKQQKNIKSIQSFVGTPPVLDFNGMFRGVSERQASHQITLKLNLTHPNDRDEMSEILARRYRELLKALKEKYPELRVQIVEDPPGPPVRSTFWIKVKAEDDALLKKVALDIEKQVQGIEGVADIDISLPEEVDKYVLSIDKKEAARSKVSVESIARELETIYSGRIIGVYHSDKNHEQEYVVLKLKRDLRDSIEDLEKIFIVNELGNHVPVSRYIKVRKEDQDNEIRNDNREKVIYLYGEMGKRSVTYAAIDLLNLLYRYKIPGEKSEMTRFTLLKATYDIDGQSNVKIEVGGEWDLTVKVFRDLGLAMGVAIILIYLVLVAQFKSFLIPLLILITIPLALIGVLPGFSLLFSIGRVYFSATSMIGVIALAGIVVNNAIIFLEYTIQSISKHDNLKDTLIDAGKTRLRPIMLTSITTVLGSLVIAADPVWSGLAWSIVFGLSLSSVLTLVVFPNLIYQFLGEKWFQQIKNTPLVK